MSAHLIFSRDLPAFWQFLADQFQLVLVDNPDVVVINPDRQGISIEAIRDLENLVLYPPVEAEVKTIILANFDQAGIPAQNAFLKMLEEHPDFIRFILQARDDQKVLDTIKSRTQIKILTAAANNQSTILAETFLALFPTANHAQLIDWCTTHKERDEAIEFLTNLVTQLHLLNQRQPQPRTVMTLEAVSLALSQIEQNFNVLLTLENCLFNIKSRF